MKNIQRVEDLLVLSRPIDKTGLSIHVGWNDVHLTFAAKKAAKGHLP